MANDFWEYDPATNTWTQKASFAGAAIAFGTCFSIGAKGYIGTGWDGSINRQDFWEYDQATNTWIQKLSFPGTARWGDVGFSIGTKGYIGTGITGTATTDFWEWDQATNLWTQKSNFGGTARLEAVGFSLGTKGYISTGNDLAVATNDFWEWNQATNVWTQQPNFPGAIREYGIGFSINCKGYIGTGWSFSDSQPYFNDFWEYAPTISPCSMSAIITSQNILCFGNCSGTSTVNPSNGTSPYTFSWSNSQTSQTISNLCVGNYSVLITDATGATATATTTISQPTALSVTTTVSQNICFGNNGSATITANGGTPGYSYSWNPSGQTSQTATGLGAGTFSITVTDANGCTKTQTVLITSANTFSVNVSSTQTGCSVNNGTATASPSSGTNPFTYNWNNGQTTQTSTGLASGNYSVTVTDANGCTGTNSVSVTAFPNPVATISGNNTLCTGDNATLTASGGGTYQWSNGMTGAVIIISLSSTASYSVIVTNVNGCTDSTTNTVSVFSAPSTTISGNTNLCQGQISSLSESGPGNYLWNTGETTSSIIVNNTGTYSVVVSIGSCADSSSTFVNVNPNPIANALSNVTITQGQSTTLTATGGGNYSWNNGETSSAIVVSPPTSFVYCVTVIDSNNCSDSACVTVTVKQKECTEEVFIPNAFTPNDDYENDILIVEGTKCVKTFSLFIYNRWGEKVFESTDALKGWDGSYKGKKEKTEVYTYYLEGTYLSGSTFMKKGNISLLR